MSGAVLPLRDATCATGALIAAIAFGSRWGASLDPALFGYLGATLVAAFATTWRVSAFWRRPASAVYARALFAALAHPSRLHRTAGNAARDLAAQDFIRRRGTARWISHLLLSLGTLASFAITVPLVFGWMHFVPAGDRAYRMVVFTLGTLRFDVDGAFAWLLFHALSLSGVAVVLGVLYFVALRWRQRRLPGITSSFAVAPLVLLLFVACTGLALPASRHSPAAFAIASWLHQASVVVLLVALPFSKLAHVLIRPLQLGARALLSADAPRSCCTSCGVVLAPTAQQEAVAALLAQRGMALAEQVGRCQPCRRRRLAAAQASLVGASFQPGVRVGPAVPAVAVDRDTRAAGQSDTAGTAGPTASPRNQVRKVA